MRAVAVVIMFVSMVIVGPDGAAGGGSHGGDGREVMFLANAEGATVDVIDATSFDILKRIDVIPDGDRPSALENPAVGLLYPVWTDERIGGVNLAQDLQISPDGRTVYVARGHRGDVAAFDVATGAMLWKVRISGLRADHMQISQDGARLFVSALIDAGHKVEVVDVATHKVIGSFPTGEWPHELVLSADGDRIYNGSMGNIVTPDDTRTKRPEAVRRLLVEPNQLTIANAETLQVERTFALPRGIRPFVITRDEATMFLQMSEFHGIAEFDLRTGRMRATRELPIDDGLTSDDYDFEAPHHGLDISHDETKLCIAGRASDYAAIVSTQTLLPLAIIDTDDAPGDAHTSPDGRYCFVANNRADTVSVISYETLSLVATIDVSMAGVPKMAPKHLLPAIVPEDVLVEHEPAPGPGTGPGY